MLPAFNAPNIKFNSFAVLENSFTLCESIDSVVLFPKLSLTDASESK